jgi:hypothetical protein
MYVKAIMIIKSFFSPCLIGLLLSCNSRDGKQKESDQQTQSNLVNCYRYTNDKDTIILRTINVGEAITGILTYNFYQKEKDYGTIRGGMRGNLLIVNFTSFSGENQSVRQVVFKKLGNDFIEGHGETEEMNDRVVYRNIDLLVFKDSVILLRVDCK